MLDCANSPEGIRTDDRSRRQIDGTVTEPKSNGSLVTFECVRSVFTCQPVDTAECNSQRDYLSSNVNSLTEKQRKTVDMIDRQDSDSAHSRGERFPASLQFDQHALRDLPLIPQDLDIVDFQPAGRCPIQPDALNTGKVNKSIRTPASCAGSRQFVAIHEIIRSP